VFYTEREIKQINRTCRDKGPWATRIPKVFKLFLGVAPHLCKDYSILDYGAGKRAIWTQFLRKKGFNVTAYDVGENVTLGVHDPNACDKKYDLILMSNVVQVQPSFDKIDWLFHETHAILKKEGEIIFNFCPIKKEGKIIFNFCPIKSIQFSESEAEIIAAASQYFAVTPSYIKSVWFGIKK